VQLLRTGRFLENYHKPTAPYYNVFVTISHNQKIVTLVLASVSTKERTARNGATDHNLNSFTRDVVRHSAIYTVRKTGCL
jgi:hypothetical protein